MFFLFDFPESSESLAQELQPDKKVKNEEQPIGFSQKLVENITFLLTQIP